MWAYCDGSFRPSSNSAGIAVALYVRHAGTRLAQSRSTMFHRFVVVRKMLRHDSASEASVDWFVWDSAPRICAHECKILFAAEVCRVSSQSYSISCHWLVCSLQRVCDLRADGHERMRASNLRAYACRDLVRMRVGLESADTSVRYSVLQSFFRVILCKMWLGL